jgi:hypothetical protein
MYDQCSLCQETFKKKRKNQAYCCDNCKNIAGKEKNRVTKNATRKRRWMEETIDPEETPTKKQTGRLMDIFPSLTTECLDVIQHSRLVNVETCVFVITAVIELYERNKVSPI